MIYRRHRRHHAAGKARATIILHATLSPRRRRGKFRRYADFMIIIAMRDGDARYGLAPMTRRAFPAASAADIIITTYALRLSQDGA